MLTRLKVTGFKNLVDVDVRFGPFTCIAGPNGAGKSNLFDAIIFLSSLADKPLIDAARSVRDEGGRASDIRSLFHRVGSNQATEISFEAEMIVPESGIDDLGQIAKAKITFLRYRVTIGFSADNFQKTGGLELLHEELSHINLGTASQNILFPHKIAAWRHSAVKGRRNGGAFISTEGKGKERIVELHADGDGGGRPRQILAANLARTVLSTVNTAENPTALMAKREFQSWRLLRLEPSALRKPDEITSTTRLGADGSHLAAMLYHLPQNGSYSVNGPADPLSAQDASTMLYTRLSRRLMEFIDDVREITIDHDEKREILTIMLTGRDGTAHAARSLSDGTLRFLALAVLEIDTKTPGILCLEEPENGIHPESIQAMLSLLRDIAVDVENPVGSDNPLRQVIINTHSPAVVSRVPEECLLVAELIGMQKNGREFNTARFCSLEGTWRQNAPENPATFAKERLRAFIPPAPLVEPEMDYCAKERKNVDGKIKITESRDSHPLLPFPVTGERLGQ